jgi:hypothetical protein
VIGAFSVGCFLCECLYVNCLYCCKLLRDFSVCFLFLEFLCYHNFPCFQLESVRFGNYSPFSANATFGMVFISWFIL